jgi:prepilin-type N-terminal cleavage/methylation domain-containing protein
MNQDRKNGAGFTLIEVLVVTAVIGVISSIMVVNWRKNEGQYQLQRAAQEIVQNIRKAQDFALSGKRILWTPTGEWKVPDYGVYFRRLNPTYFLYVDVIGNDGYQSPEDLIDTTTLIETGIEISSFGGGSNLSIIFEVPDGFIRFYPSGGAFRTITVRKTGKSCPSINCRNIIIRETGEISIQ